MRLRSSSAALISRVARRAHLFELVRDDLGQTLVLDGEPQHSHWPRPPVRDLRAGRGHGRPRRGPASPSIKVEALSRVRGSSTSRCRRTPWPSAVPVAQVQLQRRITQGMPEPSAAAARIGAAVELDRHPGDPSVRAVSVAAHLPGTRAPPAPRPPMIVQATISSRVPAAEDRTARLDEPRPARQASYAATRAATAPETTTGQGTRCAGDARASRRTARTSTASAATTITRSSRAGSIEQPLDGNEANGLSGRRTSSRSASRDAVRTTNPLASTPRTTACPSAQDARGERQDQEREHDVVVALEGEAQQ